MTTRALACLCLVPLFSPSPALAKDAPAERWRRIDSLVVPAIENELVPALVVAVIDADGARVQGYGETDAGNGRRPDADTVFEIGSMTKTFTGLLLADAVERKLMGLDDPISRYLPEPVSLPAWQGRPITLLDLATHTSGLPRMPSNFAPKDPLNPYADYTDADMLEFLSRVKLSRAPGALYEYSNYAAGLAGYLVARRAGASYEELLRARITAPLHMTSTSVVLSADQRARLAPGHGADDLGTSSWDFAALAGCGGIRSTGADLVSYVRANLGLAKTPLASAIAASHVPRREIGKGQGHLGLFWHIRPDGVIWHNGGTGGYHSFMGLDEKRRFGVVVLGNSTSGVPDEIGSKVLEVLAGGTPAPPKVRPLARLELAALDGYTGDYELAPGFVITVTREGPRLFAQATGQGRCRIYPASATKFFYRVVEAEIDFVPGAGGKAEKLILHQNGQNLPAPRRP